MEKARIAVFEDNNEVRTLLGEFLTHFGHEMVVQADSIQSAREVVGELDDDVIDVAIVDGNLSADKLDSSDGAEIVRLLKSKLSKVVTIGYSGSEDVVGADLNLKKGNPARLIETIADL